LAEAERNPSVGYAQIFKTLSLEAPPSLFSRAVAGSTEHSRRVQDWHTPRMGAFAQMDVI
jgi:hypothetical protein